MQEGRRRVERAMRSTCERSSRSIVPGTMLRYEGKRGIGGGGEINALLEPLGPLGFRAKSVGQDGNPPD
jgi:hypothetical protein